MGHDKDYALDHLRYLEHQCALRLRPATSSFLRLDANCNGSLDRAEVLAFTQGDNVVADKVFADLDSDSDGKITNVEWQKFFIKKYSTAGGDGTLKWLPFIEEKL